MHEDSIAESFPRASAILLPVQGPTMRLSSTFQFSLYSIALLSTLSTSVNALGINCQGSFKCGDLPSSTAQVLRDFISQIPDGKWYNNGQQIACVLNLYDYGGVCAFLQHTGGTNGQVLKSLAPYIPGHGCTRCGSVPYFYPGNNNVNDGELTFNFVSNPCGSGLCS